MPKFSVTIPAYKQKFLKEAIESVLNQHYKDFELIIVDDCSPENLKSIVDQFSDERIHYFKNEKNCGAVDVVDNWNICLNYCKGDYIICIGDDDRLLPCCLDEYSDLIEKYPNLNVFHAWTQIINEKGEVYQILEPRPEWESSYSLTYYRWKGRRQFIGDFCYKSDQLRENGGYYKLPLAWGSDDITAVRAAQSFGIANTKCPCFEYRVNSMTISTRTDFVKIKLKASLTEKEWFLHWISNIDENELSQSDKWYLSHLNIIVNVAFKNKMIGEIINDIKSCHFLFFKWLIQCSQYDIKKRYLLKKIMVFYINNFIIHFSKNNRLI